MKIAWQIFYKLSKFYNINIYTNNTSKKKQLLSLLINILLINI